MVVASNQRGIHVDGVRDGLAETVSGERHDCNGVAWDWEKNGIDSRKVLRGSWGEPWETRSI